MDQSKGVLRKFGEKLCVEFLMSFLLGAAPVFLASLATDIEILNKTMKELISSGFSMWYLFCLSVVSAIYCLITGFFPVSDGRGIISSVLANVYKEVQVIFRVAAGALVAFSVVWVYEDRASVDLRLGCFLFYGFLALCEVTIFSVFSDWLDDIKAIEP